MNFSRLRAFCLSLVSLVATAAYAVEQLPEKEEDIPVEYVPRLDYTVSIGLHRLDGGPKVRFGNLGVIPLADTTSSDLTDTTTKYYSNGTVHKDSAYSTEVDRGRNQLTAATATASNPYSSGISLTKIDANGVVTVYTPIMTALLNADGTPVLNSNGTYVPVTSTTITTGSDGTTSTTDAATLTWATTSQYLAYKEGQTRSWNVSRASQINADNTVSMSTYNAVSRGASVDADSSGSTGFEVSLERKLGQRGRLEWGVSGGLKLVEINAKAVAVVQSDLYATTDVYKMVNTGLNSATGIYYSKPTGTAAYSSTDDAKSLGVVTLGGTTVYKYVDTVTEPSQSISGGDQSTITPLDTTNVNWGVPTQAGTVNIHGRWQLKGTYYLVHLAPTFRYHFNDRFAISGMFGLSVGYVGTVFRAYEYFDSYLDVYNNDGTPMPLSDTAANSTRFQSNEENTTHKFLLGAYGEFNAEYWMTERTGFYFGLSMQAMNNFNQNKLSGRTATIDMGKTAGWRLGIMTKF